MGAQQITAEEADAILQVRNGADVYGYGLAKLLRGMERRGITGLFHITKAMEYRGDGTDQMPYFGCIATKEGIKLAEKMIYKPFPIEKIKVGP